MYHYTVPFSTAQFDNSDREKNVKTLHEMKVSRVILGTGPYFFDSDKRAVLMAAIKRNCEYLKAWNLMHQIKP